MTSKKKLFAAGLAAAALVAAPLSASAQDDDSIAAIAVAGGFNTLVAAVGAASPTIGETLGDCDAGPITVFAPTDAAFTAALTALGVSAEDVLGNQELLDQILLYHVVEGAVTSDVVVTLDSATTLQGEDISIAVVGEGVQLNGSVNVTDVDIEACNGVIHVIDFVLVPPTILEALTAPPTTAAPTTAPTTDPLPETGAASTMTALVAGLLLLGGAGFVVLSRRRVSA